MAFKKFIAIHTYHSEETKKKFWSGVSDNTTTDVEWVKNGILKKRNVVQLRLEQMIFSFVSGRQKIRKMF